MLKSWEFDELLQRDLDDSRVAHDLIPYLLRESGNKSKVLSSNSSGNCAS